MTTPARRRDLGRVAKLRCPHCHEVTFYHLREGRGPADLYLQCAACNYDVAVDPDDIAEAQRLAGLGHAFGRREITAREHADAIKKSPLPALVQLLIEGQINHCPTCNEEVPADFARCWSCGGEVTPTVEAKHHAADAVGFPDPIFGFTPLINQGTIEHDPPVVEPDEPSLNNACDFVAKAPAPKETTTYGRLSDEGL